MTISLEKKSRSECQRAKLMRLNNSVGRLERSEKDLLTKNRSLTQEKLTLNVQLSAEKKMAQYLGSVRVNLENSTILVQNACVQMKI